MFDLHCPAGPVPLRENYGFSRREIAMIEGALTESLAALCDAWEVIHGIR